MRFHSSRVVFGCRRQPLEYKTDVSVAVALVALTALWIALAVVDTGRSHVRRRSYWFSLLIGALRSTSGCSSVPRLLELQAGMFHIV